jgi:hypothetical protein
MIGSSRCALCGIERRDILLGLCEARFEHGGKLPGRVLLAPSFVSSRMYFA